MSELDANMIPSRPVLAAIAVLAASTISAFALESTVTARSSLSQEALWQTVSDFCAEFLWNPAVEDCVLSDDGKVRTLSLFGGGKVEQVLEYRTTRITVMHFQPRLGYPS